MTTSRAHIHRRTLLKAAATPLLAAAGSGLLASSGVFAAEPAWPTQPVRVVVPFSAGGVADVLARIVAKGLSERWRQPVVVENLVGAGGNIGLADVVRREADGRTIALAPGGNLTINPHYYKNLPFNVDRDFTPVTILADAPNVLVVSPKLGVTTVKDLIALGRSKQHGLSYGSPGDGSTQHLAGALLGIRTKLELLHVPYRGLAPAMTDVMAGQIDMIFAAASTVAPHVREGKLVALAIAGPNRTEILPNVPSMLEAGVPDFDANSWYGFIVKKGTPENLLVRINKDINEVLVAERERLVAMGLFPSGKGLQQFTEFMRNESGRWKSVMTTARISEQ